MAAPAHAEPVYHPATIGGWIGDGRVSIASYHVGASSADLPTAQCLTYEKALVGLARSDLPATADPGIATISKGRSPLRGQSTHGVTVILSTETVDRFLSTGAEERAGPIEDRLIENPGPKSPDRPLLELSLHAIDFFDRYCQTPNLPIGRQMEALIIETFVQLLRDTSALILKRSLSDTRFAIVGRAKDYMHAQYGEPITIANVALAVGTNIRSLQAAFKSQLGVTPRQYLTAVRLEQAHANLKSQSSDSVTTVGYNCGFTHMGRFGQIYRRQFGELPSETLAKGGTEHGRA